MRMEIHLVHLNSSDRVTVDNKAQVGLVCVYLEKSNTKAFEEKENDQLNKCGTLLNRYIADFSHASKQGIKKLLSRQGLCLGTSIATIKVKDSEIAQTPDEHFEDYCTTDGAGVCVLSCLREAAIEFNNQMGREVLSVAPTAMQAR